MIRKGGVNMDTNKHPIKANPEGKILLWPNKSSLYILLIAIY